MKKFHNKALGIAFLVMLATAPLSISYSFADDSKFESEQKMTKSTNNEQEELRAILTEKVVDGKLEVKRFALPENLSEEDMKRMVSKGETSGWAYMKQKSYQAGIILFNGKAIKVGENLWKLSSEVDKTNAKTLDLEKSKESNVLQEITHGEEINYKVIFSGKMTEAGSETFAVIFTNSGLKNLELGQNIKFDHNLEWTEFHSNSNQGFERTVLVG